MSFLPGVWLHRWSPPALAWLCFTCAGAAGGAVFKCATSNNGVVYQDTPCPVGSELRNLDKDPPSLSVVPGLPSTSTRSGTAATSSARGRDAADRRDARGKSRADKAAERTLERAGERRFIRAGMTEAEVLTRIGRPDVNAHKRETTGKGTQKHGGAGVEWSYLPNAGDPQTITTLTIVGGKVTDVRRSISR